MFSLEGKVSFITSGASGIGLAVARRYVQACAKVVIADLQEGAAVAEEIGARYIRLDVSDPQQVESVLAITEKEVNRQFRTHHTIQRKGEQDGEQDK
jgi:NAD(P)-dependent dehydrogenase (short-subunit alcohol dehydrogenase family)